MSDGYGRRTSAQRAWLAGAVVLVAVLVVGGGWLAWQGITHPHPPSTAASPQGSLPVAGQLVGFGAPRVIDGVPWGFPLTAEGAAAAASVAVAVTGQPQAVFDPARFAQVAAVVFTPAQAAVQTRQVDAARTRLEVSGWAEQPPARRSYHFAPLAVRLEAFDPTGPAGPSATVVVWAMTLVGVGDAGGAVFTTSTVQLTADGDGDTWTVTGLESVEGPTPVVAATATAPGRVRALLRDAVATLPLPLPPPSQAK